MPQRFQKVELMNGPVLVVAAHPDDEALGCGGTIAKLALAGERVHVMFLADGVSSRMSRTNSSQEALQSRRAAAEKACQILGVTSVEFGEYPDNQLDTVSLLDVVKSIELRIESLQPQMVLTHHSGDVNIDHRRIHEAVSAACRPQRGRSVRSILCFEVPSSTEWQFPCSERAFVPNWFVDVSETFDRKIEALKCYSAELRAWPHPRSIEGVEHLNRWRGATVGVDAAESFVLVRQIA